MLDNSTNHTRSTNITSSPETLSIWQQKVNRSPTCQHDLILSTALTRRGIDIVALQEPAIASSGTAIASGEWTSIYLTTHSKDLAKTRSVLLIRNSLLTKHWKQIDFPSGDVTVIQLNGGQGTLMLFNIYNGSKSNETINLLKAFTHSLPASRSHNTENSDAVLWLGNFNRHHPHWDNPADTRPFTRSAIENAEILISTVAGLGLDLALPQGILTHLHNVSKKWTRLDHVFITEDFLDMILTCNVLADTPGINTDHVPILTTLDLSVARAPLNPPKFFRNVD